MTDTDARESSARGTLPEIPPFACKSTTPTSETDSEHPKLSRSIERKTGNKRMRLDDYQQKDGKRVWLTADEVQLLIDEAQTAAHCRPVASALAEVDPIE